MTSIHQQEASVQQTCPHLGKEFQPFDSPQLDNPYPFYQRARREEPIFYSPVLNGYVVTRYDDILTVLKDPARFSSANILQPINQFTPEVIDVLMQGFPAISEMVNTDGEQHQRLRAPFVKVFAPERLQALEDSIYAIANRLVDSFSQEGQAEIVSQFTHLLPLEAILTLYGVPLEMMANIKQWCSDMSALFTSPLTPAQQVECARGFVAFQHTIADLIAERRVAPQDDLISHAQDSDLTLPELVSALGGLILAGHKTSTNLVGNALKVLLERPERWQSLCHDPSLIPAALEEVLRYDTPGVGLTRTTTQDVSLAGVTLPKGARVFLIYGSGNHDETQHRNSDRFEIDRFVQAPVNHLGFGYGVHRCIGSNLARREGRIALEVLPSRLPNLRLRPNQELSYTPSLMNRGLKQLYVEWDVASFG